MARGLFLGLALCVCNLAMAHTPMPGPEFYRNLTDRIRPDGHFRIYMPDGRHQDVTYHFKFAKPIYPKPIVTDQNWGVGDIVRLFWDRILFEDESYLEVGGERLPLTCVFVSGQDNRFSKGGMLTPEFLIRIYLVANDFACEGPIRKGWPQIGGKKEAWDTYMHYEVRDPTIMLPQDAVVRYRWNETNAVLIDKGN